MTTNKPYIYSIDKDGKRHSFFAIRLASIATFDPSLSEYKDFAFELLNKQIDFINSIDCPEDDRVFELRFICRPDRALHSKGKVDTVLITKASNPDKAISARKAVELFNDIWSMLSVLTDYYEFEFIKNKGDFLSVYEPFRFNSIAEIMRREDFIEVESAKRMRGFGDIKGDEARQGKRIYFAYPFIWSSKSMSRVCNVMLFQKEPCFLSVSLKPIIFNNAIEDFFLRQIDICESYLTSGAGGNAPVNSRINFINSTLHSQLLRLEDSPFLMKIRIVGKKDISESLIDSVGVEITEHAGSPDLIEDVNDAYVFSGGYDCYRFVDKAKSSEESENIKLMDFRHLAEGISTGEDSAIRYLFDPTQANCAFRLPVPEIKEFPGIETRFYKKVMPPPDIAAEGIIVGRNTLHGQEQYVKLSEDDRRKHMYVVGQTGTGKSTLFLKMIMQDILNEKGVAVFDPHGELINEVLPRIPERRADDVIYINFENTERPIALNMLEFRDDLEKDFAITQLIEIFDKIYDLRQTGGPMFEQYMMNALYLIMEDVESGSTILEAQKVFTEPRFREYKLSKCTNEHIKEFWGGIADKAGGEASLENMAPYITSKLTRFIYNSMLRNIISPQQSSFEMRRVMDEGKIILVDLCKSKIGSLYSHFLGMILIGKILMAALSRRDTPDKTTLKDFYLYVDEFQNLATKTFIDVLSETRKFKLNVILTNQYLTQISEEVRGAIIGNVGAVASFRVGTSDAEVLEKEFYPTFTKFDLMRLPNFRVCMSMLNQGEAVRPFEILTLPEESKKDYQIAERIKKHSAEKYGRRPEDIEKEIKLRWKKAYAGH